jgi:hypothetical protein
MAMAKNPAQRFQTADAMRGALRSVAPVLGEPTPFAPEIPDSTLDMSAQQTPYPARPSTPRSVTARPVAQQPITARPVTARPVTARPLTAQPVATPPLAPTPSSVPLAPTIPLSGSAPQYPQPHVPVAVVAPAQASAGNRRGLYIALSAMAVIVVLVAAGFGAKRWLDSRSSENSTTAPADNPAPTAPASTLDPTPSPVMPAVQTVPAADTTPSKSTTVASVKPRANAPRAAQNPSPQQDTPQPDVPQPAAPQPSTQQPSVTQPVPTAQPAAAAQPDHRVAEQSARKTVASVAQLAALEHEEFDELSARDNSVNARIAALPQQPGADIAASQQQARNELALAQRALKNGDVQNAQKYMEQADAEITKIEKLIGH